MNTSDTERSHHPIELTTLQLINNIHDITMNESRLKVPAIASCVDITSKQLHNLKLNKQSEKWVPRLLTV